MLVDSIVVLSTQLRIISNAIKGEPGRPSSNFPFPAKQSTYIKGLYVCNIF